MASAPSLDTPAQRGAPLLEARALAFYRQDEAVFGPLDFSLTASELMLIEGDNGSGKTTLMRILTGLLRPEEGELFWRGERLTWDRCSGEVVFLGHQLGLKAELSARENLAFTIGLHGHRNQSGIEQALTQVGLSGLEDEPVRKLSAGQKKRVALARLLLVPAILWLLDEPYANLDRAGIELVDVLLEAHIAHGGSALVTSHGAVQFHGGEPQRIHLHD
ncbi:cytochrome c biogenesis heme-transporting ATPase CcmA [Dyella monticola]|uniref:Cytochrome c biogenesis heme-transporting ATPase CcmA n=1 Tax=Dyella monticola TaxID=1927958 RepID=A0A370WWN4_9GAMM|nr:cytochrome c biogenesis heme-transporting ATPase CcmA [Dyella monticola]RDS80563.1 cytochrome c biogenesis heme-transporting ATPase CcmA [Dyella monticola]